MTYLVRFDTLYGEMAILWENQNKKPRVKRIFLPRTKQKLSQEINRFGGPFSEKTHPLMSRLARDLKAYFKGKEVNFDYVPLDLDSLADFEKRVLTEERKIRRGNVLSYQALATKAGNKKASRAVGNIQAKNAFPVVIPCHRIVRADKRIGHFQTGSDMKKRMLELEGVSVQTKETEAYVVA